MKTLTLADNLTLPLDLVTQTMAILAKRRAGKSYTMRRLVEQLVQAHQQVVLVDPKGDQWGIRSAADGKGPGLPLVILGGERADVPLEVGAGEVVAKLVVEERVSVVLDLSLFRKREVASFMADFLETLYRLKAREQYRTPMLLVVDEADAIAPQKPLPGEERMLGAIEDIVRRGGQRGIGCVVVTQRSAVLNKNVLTQAQILVALRTIAPQDLRAMKEWIDVHGEESQRKVLMESLPSLPIGDAWFWSPGWPTVEGIFARVHVLPIETFDSGATPKPGEKRVEPKTVADVDLDALKRQMAATIERVKADDPRELHRQLRELRSELDKATGDVAAAQARLAEAEQRSQAESGQKVVSLEVRKELAKSRRALEEAMKFLVKIQAVDFEASDPAALEQAVAAAVGKVVATFEQRVNAAVARVENVKQTAAAAERSIKALLERDIDLQVQVQRQDPFTVSAPAARREPAAAAPSLPSSSTPNGDVPPVQQRILDALAELAQLGAREPARELVAMMAGYTHLNSKGLVNALGALRSAGAIDYGQGTVVLTPHGKALARPPARPRTAREVQDRVVAMLGGASGRILRPLIDAYPGSLPREAVASQAGYGHLNSKGFVNAIGRLRTLGFIDYPDRGTVKAMPVLFLER